MPAAARGAWEPLGWAGDTVSVHECGVAPNASTGSSNVFINGKPAHRVGDSNTSHPSVPSPSCATHTTNLSSGSPNVSVNGEALARDGDLYDCGIRLTSGSWNVLVNDSQNPNTSTSLNSLIYKASDETWTDLNTSFKSNNTLTGMAIEKVVMDGGLTIGVEGILEFLATILFGSIASAEPLENLSEAEFKAIFESKSPDWSMTTKEYIAKIEKMKATTHETAKHAIVFRSKQGYLSRSDNVIGIDEFMRKYKGELQEFDRLTSRQFELREKLTVYDPVKKTYSSNLELLTTFEQKEMFTLEKKIRSTENLLLKNIAHRDLAAVLWKYSSFVIEKPMFVLREHDLYGIVEALEPEQIGRTYSTTLVDFKDVDYTTSGGQAGESVIGGRDIHKKQYYMLPTGTRVIHTLGMADTWPGYEVLVRGDDLVSAKNRYSGSALQAMMMEYKHRGAVSEDLMKEAVEIYRRRHNGADPPAFWHSIVDTVEEIDKYVVNPKIRFGAKIGAISATAAAFAAGGWIPAVIVFSISGVMSWFLNSDEYWDIYNAEGFVDLEKKLAIYYGHTTKDILGPDSAILHLNELAIFKSAQLIDITTTLPFATWGAAQQISWEQSLKAIVYLMEEMDNIVEGGNAAIEELLTPPDGWENP
jgi:uncharacterized Zn-binding protein involved in type VI secretion